MAKRLSSEMKLVGLEGIANAGTYIAIPFLSVYLLDRVGLAPWQIGTITTVLLVSGRLFPTLTGTFGDRYGHHVNIGLGIFLRGVGFLLMGTMHTFPMFVVSGVLIGIGGAFYGPSVSVLLSQSNVRSRSFVWLNIAQNAGTVAGPLLGIWLSSIVAQWPFLWPGILLMGFGLFVAVSLRDRGARATPVRIRGLAKNFIRIVSSRNFLMVNGLMILFWIDFAQLTVSIPLRAFKVGGTQSLVGTINIANGVVGMLAAIVFKKLFDRYSPKLLIAIGFIPLGIGFLLIPLFATVLWLLFCVLLFTIGETLVLPSSDLAIAELANSDESGIYFGVSQLSWAIGGSIGNFIGVIGARQSSNLPWIICTAVAFLGFIAFMSQHIRGDKHTIRHSS